MSNVFGSKKPLFGPYTYRAKQNSNGDTLIAVYHGSKRIAHIDAYWAYSMRAIEEHEAEEAQRASGSGGTRRRLVCATDLRALGAEGRYPNVLRVGHAFMDDEAYKGKGIGRAMYEAMMVEGFAVRETRVGGQPGPMFLIPDECGGAGNTSADAKRVWASLARDYPSQGTSIRVDAPPVIGSRAKVNPRRRNSATYPRVVVALDQHLPQATARVEAGFYFEEGGCIGMALALQDTLRRYGVTAPLTLFPGSFKHAGVLVGKRFLDASGLGLQDVAAAPVTRRRLLEIAGKWGNTAEGVLSDQEYAQQAIDVALEEGGANPRRRNSANTREEDESVPDCAWCGAACDQPRPYPNRRGEVFCSPAHRSASNRALARVLDEHGGSTPRRRWNPGGMYGD